jgi:hypothetical protein
MLLLLLKRNTLKTSSSSLIAPTTCTHLRWQRGARPWKKEHQKPQIAYTQKRTKGNKIVVEEESNNEKHGGVGQVGLGSSLAH